MYSLLRTTEIISMSSKEFTAFLETDRARSNKVNRDAGIRLQP